MKIINNNVNGDITIDKETNLTGMITGNILVKESSIFIVQGVINGSITVEAKSILKVYGTVNGDIINDGKCEISGIINGKLIKREGVFSINDNALIKGN